MATTSHLTRLFSQTVSLPPPEKQEQPTEAPAATELPESTHALRVGETSIPVRIVGDPRSSVRYVVLHGDEETAPQAVAEHLRRYPGVLIQVVNPGERLISFRLPRLPYKYDFDLNRIFSRVGLEQNVRMLNRRTRRRRLPRVIAAVQQLADQFFPLLVEPRVPGQALIAVHNNGTGPRSNFSFETFVSADGYFHGVEALYYRRNNSPFNLFLVIDPADYAELMHRNHNVVLESPELAANDGSLSVFCGREGIRYANIETRMGEHENQVKMLDTLRDIWEARR